MSSYVTKISGVTYRVSVNQAGESTYDPPLPESESSRMASNLKEVLDTRSFPGLDTETLFWAGRPTLAEQFKGDEKYLQMLCDGARKRGYNPKPTDVYMPSLARDNKGDPNAFISAADGVSKVKRVLEAKGVDAEGPGFKVRAARNDRDYLRDAKPLAEDLVQKISKEYIAKDPKCAAMKPSALREMVIEKHGGKPVE